MALLLKLWRLPPPMRLAAYCWAALTKTLYPPWLKSSSLKLKLNDQAPCAWSNQFNTRGFFKLNLQHQL